LHRFGAVIGAQRFLYLLPFSVAFFGFRHLRALPPRGKQVPAPCPWRILRAMALHRVDRGFLSSAFFNCYEPMDPPLFLTHIRFGQPFSRHKKSETSI